MPLEEIEIKLKEILDRFSDNPVEGMINWICDDPQDVHIFVDLVKRNFDVTRELEKFFGDNPYEN